MCKFIYKWIAETASGTYDMKIESAISIIERYNLWDGPRGVKLNFSGDISTLESNVAYFKKEKNGKAVYDLFFNNLHIHASLSETEKIYSVRLKNPNDKWSFNYNTDVMTPDFPHPTNEYYEVYVWYDVPVLDITRSHGYVYKHGAWDKYVYRTMCDFFDAVNREMDVSRFNEYYHKLPKAREEVNAVAGE